MLGSLAFGLGLSKAANALDLEFQSFSYDGRSKPASQVPVDQVLKEIAMTTIEDEEVGFTIDMPKVHLWSQHVGKHLCFGRFCVSLSANATAEIHCVSVEIPSYWIMHSMLF